jgi:hypothetical protein
MFFISVASKGFSDAVSSLDATLTGHFISVDSLRLRDGEWRRARAEDGAEFLA